MIKHSWCVVLTTARSQEPHTRTRKLAEPALVLRYSQGMTHITSDGTEREKRQREIRTLKALARRGARNRFEGMALRTLRKRYPRIANSCLSDQPPPPSTPPSK
jgi:hypothetical protein